MLFSSSSHLFYSEYKFLTTVIILMLCPIRITKPTYTCSPKCFQSCVEDKTVLLITRPYLKEQ